MQKILKFLTSQTFLACLALVLAGLAIWFIGPLLSFDNLRPLASAGVRITLILLLLALCLFVLAKWPLSIIGLVTLCLFIWHAGPLLRLGHVTPLLSETARLLLIVGLVFLYLLWGMFRIAKILKASPEAFDKLFRLGKQESEKNPAELEIKAIAPIVERAVTQLKNMRINARGWWRLFEGKRYLYELPWYMIIGNPGAGKTTALANAGLKFPLADQMSQLALRDVAGTANCVWWLTNQAVLIDTAGRYVKVRDGGEKSEINRAEWKGFLKLVRAQRPRAPLNGVLAVISLADLVNSTPVERIQLAADMRARLAELRENLGIRFPVYVIVTKMDLMSGFTAYFSPLTSEARQQVWGFTLPYFAETHASEEDGLKERCAGELELLNQRISDGINTRLQEEFEISRRRELALLPEEFSALREPLSEFVEGVFMDSRYDNTQQFTTLRGLYFTSAAQQETPLAIDQKTLWQRLRRAFAPLSGATKGHATPSGQRSYFLHHLFTQLIFSEAHLVRPNLRWEFRFRLMRGIGHALTMLIFACLILGVSVSFDKNSDYLSVVHAKNAQLAKDIAAYYAKPDSKQVPTLLDETVELTHYNGLKIDAPDSAWRYGLYSPPRVAAEGGEAYRQLSDRLLLPLVVRRMEALISEAIKEKDREAVYHNLRIYLLMHDASKFNAEEIKIWLLKDWEDSDNIADLFGGKLSVVEHVRTLFSGQRVVQSPFPINEALVKQARAMLDDKPSLTRIYERLKMDMYEKAPEDFTLVRAIGPQVGTVLSMGSGGSLDQGVSGLFTYAGYHELFQKKLPSFLAQAYESDAWVMGRPATMLGQAAEAAKQYDINGPLATEIRRLYLSEYAEHWEKFLDDVRALTGHTRAFNLQVVRSFAAPDSPLSRLGKSIVKETTLSRALSSEDVSLFDKARAELDKKTKVISTQLGMRAEVQLERQLVDNRFSALREIVTGSPDAGGEASAAASAGADGAKSGLASINGLINAYYTQLVVADNALLAQTIPPPNDADSKLRLEIAKMPAPLRGILTDLLTEGMRTVNLGIGEILTLQTEAKIGEFCRRSVEGKYPFAQNTQEVNLDDFILLFANGGLIEDFFQKNLDPYVDSSSNPWRYKQTSTEIPPIVGPSLEGFVVARKIRDIFFRDQNPKKISWKADLLIQELDPNITDLTLDFDGQVYRYAHGPVLPWNITWPGPRGGGFSELTANPRISSSTSVITVRGAWSLFRALERGQLSNTGNAGKILVDYDFDGRHALFELNVGSTPNPLTSDILKQFKCPGRSL